MEHRVEAAVLGILILADGILTTMGILGAPGVELNPVFRFLFDHNLSAGLFAFNLLHVAFPLSLFHPSVENPETEQEKRQISGTVTACTALYAVIFGFNMTGLLTYHGVI